MERSRQNLEPIAFQGTSLDDLRTFPAEARREAGHQLDRVQRGLDPDDWKPMPGIGPGVREVRVRDEVGAFRVTLHGDPTRGGVCAARLPEEDPADGQAGPRSGRGAVVGADTEGLVTETADGIPGEVFESVWDALEDSPAAAANMRLRSELMTAVQETVAEWGLTQTEAARRLDVTQPRLNDLLRGRIDRFGLDALILLATRAGLSVRVRIERTAA